MGAALVGPLKPVRYNNRTDYRELPRNTIDVRYEACADHHLACDCREADLAETLGELRYELDYIRGALLGAIKGHPTWAYTRDGMHEDPSAQCKCQVCGIAREHFIGFTEWYLARQEADRQLYPHQEVPF